MTWNGRSQRVLACKYDVTAVNQFFDLIGRQAIEEVRYLPRRTVKTRPEALVSECDKRELVLREYALPDFNEYSLSDQRAPSDGLSDRRDDDVLSDRRAPSDRFIEEGKRTIEAMFAGAPILESSDEGGPFFDTPLEGVRFRVVFLDGFEGDSSPPPIELREIRQRLDRNDEEEEMKSAYRELVFHAFDMTKYYAAHVIVLGASKYPPDPYFDRMTRGLVPTVDDMLFYI